LPGAEVRLSTGRLFVVAPPIGNRGDLSARAVEVLRAVALVACEDTRRTGRLLAAHSINTPMMSYFEHNETSRIPELVKRLRSGEHIALVTDAGTPAISDPGYRLVRSAIEAGINVTSVPGPSAVIAALAIAGLPTDRFAFEGFLPAKSGERARVLAQLAQEERTLVFYEAARRLPRLLPELVAAFGPDRQLAVVREATKIHEEVLRGTLVELASKLVHRELLGEVTLVIQGTRRKDNGGPGSLADEAELVGLLREAGLSLRDASAAAARITGTSRRKFYQTALRQERR